jgi:hypothetical protein
MMLFKEDTPDPKLVEICKGHETYMFNGQKQLQMVLVRKVRKRKKDLYYYFKRSLLLEKTTIATVA